MLVHGDWADASSWTSVIERLQDKGFTVVAPPNLLRGPATDAPYLASYLRTISGPIVLVAHSYGGFVATNAATGNANVKALVYIDAFMPDEGETAGELVASSGSCVVDERASTPCLTTAEWICTCAGRRTRRIRASSSASPTGSTGRTPPSLPPCSGPRRAAQFVEPSGPPAWKTIPSWSLIGTLDNVIPLRAAGGDVQPGRRSHHQGQGRPPVARSRVLLTSPR